MSRYQNAKPQHSELVHNGRRDARSVSAGVLDGGSTRAMDISIAPQAPNARGHSQSYSSCFCCGAGGGHAWLEENQGTRTNHMRTDQFLETGADTVAVSCPFCLQMFDQGLSSRDESKKRKAVDLIELVDQSTTTPDDK